MEREKSLNNSIAKLRLQQQQQQHQQAQFQLQQQQCQAEATSIVSNYMDHNAPAAVQAPTSAGFAIFVDQQPLNAQPSTANPNHLNYPPSSSSAPAAAEQLNATKRVSDRIAARPLAPSSGTAAAGGAISAPTAPSSAGVVAVGSAKTAIVNTNTANFTNMIANKENIVNINTLPPPPPSSLFLKKKVALDLQNYDVSSESPLKKARIAGPGPGLGPNYHPSQNPSLGLQSMVPPSHIDIRALVKQNSTANVLVDNNNINNNNAMNPKVNRLGVRPPPAPPSRC